MRKGSFVDIGAKDSNYGPITNFYLFEETDVNVNFFQSFRSVMVKNDIGDCVTYHVHDDAILRSGDVARVEAILRPEVNGFSKIFLVVDKSEDAHQIDKYSQ